MLTLSYSEAETFTRCPRKYYHRAVEGIQKVGYFKPPLYRGSHFHQLMMRWNLGEDYMQYHIDTVAAVEQDEDRYDEVREERLELLELAFQLFDRYVQKYAEELGEIEVLNVEEEFVLQMGEITITCTPDLVFRDADGQLWCRDYKTTSVLPNEFPWGNLQPLINTAAVSAAYDETCHFQYHHIRAKLPTEPRLNKTGPKKVNNLNRLDTTFEVLRDFLAAEAPDLLTDPEHKDKLAELRDHDRYFLEQRMYNDPAQLERARDLMLELARDVDMHTELDFFPQRPLHIGMGSCGGCEFRHLCEGEYYGYDIDRIKEEEYEPRAPKNPYDEETHDDDE